MLTLTKRAGQHEGSIDGIAVTVRENTQAAQRANGTWFLTICSTESKLAQILKCQAQFFTLTEARAFAVAVIERAGANPTRLQLLAATLRAITGAAGAHDFDPFWPYSPASGSIVFERTVSHGRGKARTYDKLVVTLDRAGDRIREVKLTAGGATSIAPIRADNTSHPFDVVDELLVGIYGD